MQRALAAWRGTVALHPDVAAFRSAPSATSVWFHTHAAPLKGPARALETHPEPKYVVVHPRSLDASHLHEALSLIKTAHGVRCAPLTTTTTPSGACSLRPCRMIALTRSLDKLKFTVQRRTHHHRQPQRPRLAAARRPLPPRRPARHHPRVLRAPQCIACAAQLCGLWLCTLQRLGGALEIPRRRRGAPRRGGQNGARVARIPVARHDQRGAATSAPRRYSPCPMDTTLVHMPSLPHDLVTLGLLGTATAFFPGNPRQHVSACRARVPGSAPRAPP